MVPAPVLKSAGRVWRPKMWIWRSGGAKSMGKQVVPVSPPPLFPRKYCYFRHPPAPDPPSQLSQPAAPDGLSASTKYTPDGLFESTKYTQNQWTKLIFPWCECRKYTLINEKPIFGYKLNQPNETIK